uniref:Ubiquinone biosynthesis protein n=1 Tax=Phallusia mammillata TaxID=59560 RepID=A0A6F9DA14_9ASCI|nr:ubiquinone biosynthesis protein COQ9-B, mitochondrial-like [Phallusia mammillata]
MSFLCTNAMLYLVVDNMAYSLSRAIINRHLLRILMPTSAQPLIACYHNCQSTKTKQGLLKNKQICVYPRRNVITSETPNPLGEETKENSDNKDKDENEDFDVKTQILDQALEFVEVYGWSREAISNGAEASGYAGVAEGMFRNGGSDLALHFVRKCNAHFEEYLKSESEKLKETDDKPNVTAFLRDAIEFRLRMIIPYIGSWPQAMSLLLHPSIITSSMGELTRMVDDVWYYAGDTSADIKWYAKRGLLAKLYGSMQLVILTDQSPDFRDTWDFLDRR